VKAKRVQCSDAINALTAFNEACKEVFVAGMTPRVQQGIEPMSEKIGHPRHPCTAMLCGYKKAASVARHHPFALSEATVEKIIDLT
jgi:hypothetical protein